MTAAGKASDYDSIINRIDSLPTIPTIAQQIAEMVADPRVDVGRIAGVLSSDQSLTAKILKLANSPYYAIPGGISDVTRAISFLGFNTLHQLVLSISVLSLLDVPDGQGLRARDFWVHALACGVTADVLGRHLNLNGREACFSAGLLHDVGKVALMQIASDNFQEAVSLARSQSIGLGEAEERLSLPNHSNVGARLAERWRLPMSIRVAIQRERYVTNDFRALPVAPSLRVFADITWLADTMVRKLRIGDPGDNLQPDIDADLLKRLNLTTVALDKLKSELQRSLEHSKTFLELIG